MVKDKLAEILNFFDPVKLKDFEDSSFLNDDTSIGNGLLVNNVVRPLPHDTRFEVAIVGVNQYIDPEDAEYSNTPQAIREQFYRLKKNTTGIRIADLGNLKTGSNINETQFALQEVCSLLFHQNINVVIIGGSQLLTLGVFRALKEFENNINLVNVDSRIDYTVSEEAIADLHFLNPLIRNEEAFIYNIANVGYQSYFVNNKQLGVMNELYFEHFRLGAIRDSFENVEPVLRDADLLSFDISAVRMSEAPAQKNGSPNGFYADEACRLARYAGISDRMQAFGLFEMIAHLDDRHQTAKLAAQIIWYYFDGYIHRKHDFPKASLSDCTKYEVQIDEIDFPIVFYKSEKTNRWWVEVRSVGNRESEHVTVVAACSEGDYSLACKNEIPDKWWINFKKLK